MEIWKGIKGYEGLYSVSNMGEVKNVLTGRILKKSTTIYGYNLVKLYNNGKKSFSVHRLVANEFIPNPENKPQVNHKNGIKSDNTVENLEWNTAKENVKHSYLINIASNKAERHPNSILNNSQVLEIRKKHSEGVKTMALAKEYNIKYCTMWKVVVGINYSKF